MAALLGAGELQDVDGGMSFSLLYLPSRLFDPATLPPTAAEIRPDRDWRFAHWHHVVMNSSTSCGRNRRSFPTLIALRRGCFRVAWSRTHPAETPSQRATSLGSSSRPIGTGT